MRVPLQWLTSPFGNPVALNASLVTVTTVALSRTGYKQQTATNVSVSRLTREPCTNTNKPLALQRTAAVRAPTYTTHHMYATVLLHALTLHESCIVDSSHRA